MVEGHLLLLFSIDLYWLNYRINLKVNKLSGRNLNMGRKLFGKPITYS